VVVRGLPARHLAHTISQTIMETLVQGHYNMEILMLLMVACISLADVCLAVKIWLG